MQVRGNSRQGTGVDCDTTSLLESLSVQSVIVSRHKAGASDGAVSLTPTDGPTNKPKTDGEIPVLESGFLQIILSLCGQGQGTVYTGVCNRQIVFHAMA